MRANRNQVKSNIGTELKKHRIKKGFSSQEKCGHYLKIRPGTYADIEAGYNVKLSTLVYVLDGLGLKLEIVEK